VESENVSKGVEAEDPGPVGHHFHPHLEQVVLGLEPSKNFLFVIYSFAFEFSKNAEAVLRVDDGISERRNSAEFC